MDETFKNQYIYIYIYIYIFIYYQITCRITYPILSARSPYTLSVYALHIRSPYTLSSKTKKGKGQEKRQAAWHPTVGDAFNPTAGHRWTGRSSCWSSQHNVPLVASRVVIATPWLNEPQAASTECTTSDGQGRRGKRTLVEKPPHLASLPFHKQYKHTHTGVACMHVERPHTLSPATET